MYFIRQVNISIGNILSNKLPSLQNNAARIIMGHPDEHGQSNASMTELGWKNLKRRRLQSIINL